MSRMQIAFALPFLPRRYTGVMVQPALDSLPTEIETERLRIRAIQATDAALIYRNEAKAAPGGTLTDVRMYAAIR